MKNISKVNLKGEEYSVGSITGIKGNKETEYRKDGDINLTPENIGAVDKAGDKMSSSLLVGDDLTDLTGGIGVKVGTVEHSGAIEVGTDSKNFGLYDTTHNKWIVYSDQEGNVTLNGSVTKAATADNATNAEKANYATTAGSTTSATSASQLTTARNIQINLASTSAASFNGTANVTPGVTGVLNITNGGTGNSTGYVTIGRKDNNSIGSRATAEGYDNIAIGSSSHAEGFNNNVSGSYSHVEGSNNNVTGSNNHAEGFNNTINRQINITIPVDNNHIGGHNNAIFDVSNVLVHGEDCKVIPNQNSDILKQRVGNGLVVGLGLRAGYDIITDTNTPNDNVVKNNKYVVGTVLGSYNYIKSTEEEGYYNPGLFTIGAGNTEENRKNGLVLNSYLELGVRKDVVCPTSGQLFFGNDLSSEHTKNFVLGNFNNMCTYTGPNQWTSIFSGGSSGASEYNTVHLKTALWSVRHGYLENGASIDFYMPVESVNSVLVRTVEITLSSNAIYGQHLYLWTCGPNGKITSVNAYASTNAGVTFTDIASDGFNAGRTIKASTSRGVYYTIYRFCM